jgi:hypothetical protein
MQIVQLLSIMPIAVVERSKARTVFARSNTAIVGSNPTEAWMFVYVLCAFFLFLHNLKWDSQPTKEKVYEDLSLDKTLHVIYKVSKLAYRIRVILIANERVKKIIHYNFFFGVWRDMRTFICVQF